MEGRGRESKEIVDTENWRRGAGSASPECIIGLIVGF